MFEWIPGVPGAAPAETVRIVRQKKPSLDSLGFHHRLLITSSRARITKDAVRGGSVIRAGQDAELGTQAL